MKANQELAELLRPETEEHQKLKDHLVSRLRLSEDKMSRFYSRWQANENRLQAFITLRDYEDLNRKDRNAKGHSPKPHNIVVPYAYSTVHSIGTYLLHTFAGRKPIFQATSYNSSILKNAANMELKLDYDAYHTRIIKHLWQFFFDQMVYGFGALTVDWEEKQAKRTTGVGDTQGLLANVLAGQPQRGREIRTIYEGNSVTGIDPFMFFPDPRVPMCEVSRKGEFVFWRSFIGDHQLKKGQAAGDYFNTVNIPDIARGELGLGSESNRSRLSEGETEPGRHDGRQGGRVSSYKQIEEGTIEIVPAEWKLSDSTQMEKWFFSLANRDRIIQAKPYDFDHDMHPVVVAEPLTLGQSFGQPGDLDFVAPLQDIMSWLVNSHVKNVDKVVHNAFIVDPMMVEMQDLKLGAEARIIRLKQSAFGQDVRQAIQQLQVYDVTQNHLRDMQVFMKLADALTGVNDNLRSVQDSGGRKTATEVRTSAESGASRLAARSRVISSHAIVDLTSIMSLNNQQFLSDEFAWAVIGEDAAIAPITIRPDQLIGDFVYPVNDGTLPMDRIAMLDAWREIMMAVVQDPDLRMAFNIPKMFLYIAELGGARNVEEFLIDPSIARSGVMPMSQETIDQEAQRGNLVPSPAGPMVNAVEKAPGRRMAENLQG